MNEQKSNKSSELDCVIDKLKVCLKKLDLIKEENPYGLIELAIPCDKDVINAVYSVIKTAISFKQSELDNQDFRVPAGSDYDLDKVKLKEPLTVTTTMAALREIVHNGEWNGVSFESLCCELIALHERKNKDYGGAFDKSMNKFGVVSLLIRLNDKFERLESLFKNGKAEVTDESFEDTLRDIACYAIMGLEHLYNTPKQ